VAVAWLSRPIFVGMSMSGGRTGVCVGGRNLNTTHGGGEREEGERILAVCRFDDEKKKKKRLSLSSRRRRLRGFSARVRLLLKLQYYCIVK
jgi:hypothetical protein